MLTVEANFVPRRFPVDVAQLSDGDTLAAETAVSMFATHWAYGHSTDVLPVRVSVLVLT